MKQFIYFLGFTAFVFISSGFEVPDSRSFSSYGVHDSVVIAPEYNGGNAALFSFIQTHLVYPKWEEEHRITGTVLVSFIIDTAGKVSQPRIEKTVENSVNFNAEVFRVLQLMPLWTPGTFNGKPISMRVSLPISFNLL